MAELVLPVRLLTEQVEFSVRFAEMMANDAVRSYRENRIDWITVDEALWERQCEIDKVAIVVDLALTEAGREEWLAARDALRDLREAAKARIQVLRDDLRANCSLFNALAQVAA